MLFLAFLRPPCCVDVVEVLKGFLLIEGLLVLAKEPNEGVREAVDTGVPGVGVPNREGVAVVGAMLLNDKPVPNAVEPLGVDAVEPKVEPKEEVGVAVDPNVPADGVEGVVENREVPVNGVAEGVAVPNRDGAVVVGVAVGVEKREGVVT